MMKLCVKDRKSSDFATAILIFNFSTLGDMSKEFYEFRDPDEVVEYCRVNIAHIPVLTGDFMDWTSSGETNIDTVVVNVSSLGAIQPLLCLSLYSSCKAAREMMLRVGTL